MTMISSHSPKMDKKVSQDLDNEFGIFDDVEPVEIEVVQEPKPKKKEKPKVEPTDKGVDLEKDYQYQRGQLYHLIDTMQEAVQGALETAQDSSHPRAYEVALNGAKATADVVEKLGDLQKKMRDLGKDTTTQAQIKQNNTQNNIFVSTSTSDLLKSLKEGGNL